MRAKLEKNTHTHTQYLTRACEPLPRLESQLSTSLSRAAPIQYMLRIAQLMRWLGLRCVLPEDFSQSILISAKRAAGHLQSRGPENESDQANSRTTMHLVYNSPRMAPWTIQLHP